MNPLDPYTISFKSLKLGNHEFDFEVKDSFFESDPGSEILGGNARVHIDLHKEERMMVMDFTLEGTLTLPCDRCSDPLEMKIKGRERLVVKLGEEYLEESDEVLVIPETSYQIDVAPLIRDYLYLLLPMRKVHGEGDASDTACDPEILRKLDELNRKQSMDPRWEALSKLKDNSEK